MYIDLLSVNIYIIIISILIWTWEFIRTLKNRQNALETQLTAIVSFKITSLACDTPKSQKPTQPINKLQKNGPMRC